MPGLGEWLVIAVSALFLLSGGQWSKTLATLIRLWSKLRGSAAHLVLEVEKMIDDK